MGRKTGLSSAHWSSVRSLGYDMPGTVPTVATRATGTHSVRTGQDVEGESTISDMTPTGGAAVSQQRVQAGRVDQRGGEAELGGDGDHRQSRST